MKLAPCLTSVCVLTSLYTLPAAIDLDGDGLGDAWEKHYLASKLAPTDDTDGDGLSNAHESAAGTDPKKNTSALDLALGTIAATEVDLLWPSVIGKGYTIQSSHDLKTWTTVGTVLAGTGSPMQSQLPLGQDHHHHDPETRMFYRVSCTDMDSDGDGASDWEEIVSDLNPNAKETTPGTSDLAALLNLLAGGGGGTATILVTAPDDRAYEAGANSAPNPGLFRLTRTGDSAPLTVAFTITGRPTQGGDYMESLGTTATFAQGVDQIDLPVTPIKDAALEVPETLSLILTPSANYTIGGAASAAIRVEDFEVQTEKLYYGAFAPQIGALTTASGYATLFLSGDHSKARVSAVFSGLTTPQTAAHVHLADNSDTVESLELGQIQNHLWSFPAGGTGTLTSDQAVLDALTSGRFYVNVHSSNYPAGEIRADLRATEGSIAFVPPAEPPPLPGYTGTEAERDVQRLLSQASFGQTDTLYAEAKSKGVAGWLAEQMNATTTPSLKLYDYARTADDWVVANALADSQTEYQPNTVNFNIGWWTNAVHGRDQLRQRVAFALSEIFVVSIGNNMVRNHHYGMADYYDMLGRNAFGGFRALLEDVTLHPIMATYLSMIRNEKYNPTTGVSPDENYAREIMQLFSIGLVQLHPDGSLKLDAITGQPIPTYDNQHITELAKIFTGWSFSKSQTGGAGRADRWDNDGTVRENNNFNMAGSPSYAPVPFASPLKMFPAYHETSAKTIVTGKVIPANQTGDKDLDDALDTLFQHQNTGPFLARRLIQRLVTSNPSRGYVYRVAQKFANDGTGARGNLGAVISAILTDYEARSLNLPSQSGYGKMREPILRFSHLLRVLEASSNAPLSVLTDPSVTSKFPAGARMVLLTNTAQPARGQVNNIGYAAVTQAPLAAPSVFNWFLPDYTFPGPVADAGLLAPEFQTATETNVIYVANILSAGFWDMNGANRTWFNGVGVPGITAQNARVALNLTPAISQLTSGGANGLVNYLDGLFTHSVLSAEARASVLSAVNATTTIAGSSANAEKVKTAIYLILNSPDYTIQR